MANYNKSFNFRNGVQVDEDNFLVNSLGLVGIGTTIPKSDLDVYGDVSVSGLTTTNFLYAGIATFSQVNIGTGITIIGNTGSISAKFFGDGAGLYNIPTSQWVDVDPAVFPGVGAGYSSIYAAGTVGIGTTIPRFYLQVGGNPTLGEVGVGINSTGNINATGILTAGFFVGSGAGVTSINASNISSGTLNASRLPVNINISGIGTIATLNSSTGIITSITGVAGTIRNFNSITGIITSITGVAATVGVLTATNAVIGIGTIATLNSSTGIITSITGVAGTIRNFNSITGIVSSITGVAATVGVLTATNAHVVNLTSGSFSTGIITSTGIYLDSVKIAVSNTNVIDTTSENLVLDSSTGEVTVENNLTVKNNLTVNQSILPDTDNGASIGSNLKYFSSVFAGDVNIGVGASNEINTKSTNLSLDSATGFTTIDDNLTVTGYSYFTGITTVQGNLVPNSDKNGSLGNSSLKFGNLYVDNVRVGVGSDNEVSTGSGDLSLNSSTGLVEVKDKFTVKGQSYFVGISTLEIGILPDNDKGAYLGASNKSFSEAYVNEVTIGSAGATVISTRTGKLILDSNLNEVVVNGFLNVTEDVKLENSLTVGQDSKTFFVDSDTKKIGIGTTGPSSDIEIIKESGQSLELQLVSDLQSKVSFGRSVGMGNDSAYISYSDDLILGNKSSSGDIIIDLSSGTGINTSSYFRISHKGLSLLSIGHDGKLGINNNSPQAGLDLIGDLLVSRNARISGIVTVGQTNAFVFDGNSSVLYGTLNGNVSSGSGISTFWELKTNSVVSIGGTFQVISGISSFRDNVFIGLSPGEPGLTTSISINPSLSVKGDTLIDGSLVLSSANSKVAISSISLLDDNRPNLGGTLPAQTNLPNIEFGTLQVHGGMTVIGYSGGAAAFVGGPNDPTSETIKYIDSRSLNDQNYQFRVGVNTHVPRSCMDLGASGSPLILPVLTDTQRQYMLDNPHASNIMIPRTVDPFALIPGSVIYNSSKTRIELGINTTGTFCGVVTLTSNGSGFEALLPPRMTTANRNTMTSSGIGSGSIIYNTTNNRLEVYLPGGWAGIATIS